MVWLSLVEIEELIAEEINRRHLFQHRITSTLARYSRSAHRGDTRGDVLIGERAENLGRNDVAPRLSGTLR